MFENIKLRLNFGRSQIRFVFVMILLIVLPITLGSETYRMTTYYPAPFGAYQNIRSLTTITAGNNGLIVLGEVSPSTGGVEIYTPQIISTILSGQGGNIVLGACNGKIRFNRTVTNFCNWVTYGLNTTNGETNTINRLCPPDYPFATALGVNAGGNCTLNNQSYISTNVEAGCMLCCKFTIN
jgi:hypothetical protein